MGSRLFPHGRSLLRSRPLALDAALPHHRLIWPRRGFRPDRPRPLTLYRPRSPGRPHVRRHPLHGPRTAAACPLHPGGLGRRSPHTPTDRATRSPGRLIPRAGTLHDPAGAVPCTLHAPAGATPRTP